MEGFFLHRKHRPSLNVLQTSTAAQGQCQFAVGEPRHIFLHIFLLRLPSWCLSCIHSTASLLQLPARAAESSQGRCFSFSQAWSRGCELGQQHEHNLCLSPGLCSQQLLLLAQFAFGLGTAWGESTALHGWRQKICLLWTCSRCCNVKPASGDVRKRLIKKIMVF